MTTNTLTAMRPVTLTRVVGTLARLALAGLTVAMAVVHYHLWANGYSSIHMIGILFLLNFIGGLILAAALLVTPTRWLSVTALLTTLFTAGTLIGLVVSINWGLFGFTEITGVPFENEAVWLESFGIGLGLIMTVAYAPATLAWWRTFRHPEAA